MAATVIDPYRTLGIPAGSSRDEAARAHRRLAKQYHPDVNPGPEAAARMRRVNEAWRILSSPTRGSRHDAGRTTTSRSGYGYGTGAPAGHWAGSRSSYGPRATSATWTTWPEYRRAGPRARRPVRPEPVESSFGDSPAVFIAAWVVLSLLLFIGTWLGSVAR